jgi:hypothetical protein
VLQATHHEPAIRHAAIAMGALHEKFTLRGDILLGGDDWKGWNESFALGQYVKALGSLLEPRRKKEKQAADVALMTCVLFICFETLRGHHGAAIAHVDAGIKIITELSSNRISSSSTPSNFSVSANPYTPLSTLNRIFIRLETQAATVTFGRRRQLISSAYDFGPDGYQQDIPQTFTSIEEARNSLEYIRTVRARSVPSSPISAISSHLEVAKMHIAIELTHSVAALRLRQWSSAFESYLATSPTLEDEKTRKSVLLLRIHKLLIGISLGIDFFRALTDETVWDEYTFEFEAIISHATELIDSSWIAEPGQKQRIFNLDTGIIIPLYFVAGKCRNYRIRRKAIELLKASGRQEGVSNSDLTARVAERLVEVEEKGLLGRDGDFGGAKNVPRENRVAWVEIMFDAQEPRAFLRYRKDFVVLEPRDAAALQVLEEWIDW